MSRALAPGLLACAVAAVVLALLPFTLSGLNQVLGLEGRRSTSSPSSG